MVLRFFVSAIFAAVLAAVPLSAVADNHTASGSELYILNLETGELESLGMIGDGVTVIGIAVPTGPDIGMMGDMDMDATPDMDADMDDDMTMVGNGETIYAITDDGMLINFSTTDATMMGDSVELSGLGDGEMLVGIDFRPATGDLIGISDGSVLYTVDWESGEATALGEALDPMLEDSLLGFDFNPTVDRIRVSGSTGQNLRLNPETGAVGVNPETDEPTIDGDLMYVEGDENAGTEPMVVAAAYTNPVADADSTVLYVLDAAAGALAIQDPPNDGVLNTVASLDADISGYASFDISVTGIAYVVIAGGDMMMDDMDMDATPDA